MKKKSLTLCGSAKAEPAWAVRPREKPGSAPAQLAWVNEVFALKFKRQQWLETPRVQLSMSLLRPATRFLPTHVPPTPAACSFDTFCRLYYIIFICDNLPFFFPRGARCQPPGAISHLGTHQPPRVAAWGGKGGQKNKPDQFSARAN